MEIALAYGTSGVTVDVPDWVHVDQFGSKTVEHVAGYDDFLDELDRWAGSDFHFDREPLIVVNDGHRSTPTQQVLEWLDTYDRSLLDSCRFLVACGTHGEPSPEHMETIFGPFLGRVRSRVAWHDCHDLSSMITVGVDHFGQQVYLNKLAAEAPQVIVITSVEPHYFAGFTGGRKSFFPGLTDMATIERNHNLANSLDCAPMKLAGNPMAEHLDEMQELLAPRNIHSIQIVADVEHQVFSVCIGQLDAAFKRSTRAATSLYGNSVEKQYDLVVAEVRPPLDKNLYQIQKALENTQAAVTDGGTVVVIAACADGVGSDHFFNMAAAWDQEKNEPVDGIRRFGSHKLSRVKAMTHRIDVRLYSTLPDDQPRQVFYEPTHDLQTLMGDCLDKEKGNRLAVVRDAGHTVIKPIDA